MKRLFKTSISAMMLLGACSAGMAMASDFKEGKHYLTLGSEAFKADNQVVKIYSTNCPFCYKYEKAVIPNYVKNLPGGVEYDAYHITTKPPFGKEKASVVAVAKTIGAAEYNKVKMAYYKHIHDDKIKFESGEEAVSFGLSAGGISKSDFDQKVKSQEVQSLLAKWDQGVAVAKIKGIPAIVVDGKYLINTQSVTSMKMLDELTAELLEK